MKKFSKIKCIAIASILFLVFLAVILWPRVSRCIFYNELIADGNFRVYSSEKPETYEDFVISGLTTLSHEPEIIDLPSFDSNTNIDLGYAQCYIDPNLISKVRFEGQTGPVTIIISESEKWIIGFLKPSEEVVSYEDELKATRTYPKSYFQICCMTEEECSEYFAMCFIKTSWKCNANGIGIFENDNVKGFIRFGSIDVPTRMDVSVYSKKYSISQLITVVTSSPEKTRKIILSLLSSYRFLADRPLEESALNQMISDAISQHPKFQPDTPDEVKLPSQ